VGWTMSEPVTTGAAALKEIASALAGKGVTLNTYILGTDDSHHCANCVWRYCEEEWTLYKAILTGFPPWNVLAAQIILVIAFEYNGCDVNNARFLISSKTFNRWYNDSAKYRITAAGGPSKLTAASGCPQCCGKSACVDFDVHLASSWDWIRSTGHSWQVRICGDGTVTKTEK
jgi:hypothetical protein